MTEQISDTQKDTVAAAPRSPGGSPILSEEDDDEAQEEQPDLMTLRVEYTTLSHQLAQLDVNKQSGQWARLYRRVQAAEERLCQAEQDMPLPQTSPSEFANGAECAKNPETAKQRAAPVNEEGEAKPPAETAGTDERQAQLRAIASDLFYWRQGLKVLRQARLPKWRGNFKWQIEAKVEALQAVYARLRAEAAKPDG